MALSTPPVTGSVVQITRQECNFWVGGEGDPLPFPFLKVSWTHGGTVRRGRLGVREIGTR